VLLSVFTPSHRPVYLDECYRSLVRQTYSDWEWVVLLNGGAQWHPPEDDPRVRVVTAPRISGVGPAKAAACEQTKGDVLIELDHDDLLASDCLAVVAEVFNERPDVVLVSSDWADIEADGSPSEFRYDAGSGWEYDDAVVDGLAVHVCHGLVPSPHNVGFIWWAPNHVRAFRREAFWRVGGYDSTFGVADDHKLMVRLFLEGPFVHVPRCLYLQRRHPDQTQVHPRHNAEIQAHTVNLYWQSIRMLTSAWCTRHGFAEVSVGVPGALGSPASTAGIDVGIDPDHPFLPFPDDSVGALILSDVLQHVVDRAAFFNECYRVLVHGGLCFTETPSTEGRGAFQDPSHRSYWNENSFWYLTQANLRPAVPGLRARFQLSASRTWFPTPWHETNQLSYVQANLIAVKEGPRQGGLLLV
jgi:hypothetical protein